MKNKKIGLMIACCSLAMVMAVGCGAKTKPQSSGTTTQNQITQTQQETKKETAGKDTEKKENKKETSKDSQDTGSKKETNSAGKKEDKKTAENNEKHKLQGKLAEKKDFMFVVEDKDKNPSAFSFKDKPKGYDDLKVNDDVVVEYTGEVSETEAFTGEVLSIKKK